MSVVCGGCSHWPAGIYTGGGKFLRCPAWSAPGSTLDLMNQHLEDRADSQKHEGRRKENSNKCSETSSLIPLICEFVWPTLKETGKGFLFCLYLQVQSLRPVLAWSSTSLLPGPDRYYTALQGHITAAQHSRYERKGRRETLGREHDDWTESTWGDKRIQLFTLLCGSNIKGLPPFSEDIYFAAGLRCDLPLPSSDEILDQNNEPF